MTHPQAGFACLWDRDRDRTWSAIPSSLHDALAQRIPLVDLGMTLSPTVRFAARALGARRTPEGWRSLWSSTNIADRYVERRLEREIRRLRPAVVLQVLDLAALSCPYFVLRDNTWSQVRQLHADGLSFESLGHPGFTEARLEKRLARERAIFDQAEGVIATSEWMRRGLVEGSGIPAQRVHLVPFGVTSVGEVDDRLMSEMHRRLVGPRSRLLFVGRDFYRKSGDLVVQAFSIIRAHRPNVTLTVVGPSRWPMAGDVPEGVDFRGALSPNETATLFATHDLFVMPSRFEAFGIAFIEAQYAGLPCIARNVCAMPEFITEGENGSLLNHDDPGELAERIERVLDSDDIYKRCETAMPEVRARYSWAVAADEISRLLRPYLQ